jgi:lantibiotic biosynthesis protein
MAHGVAGPLALLALAQMAGWSVAGQDTAINEAADWLLRWRRNTDPFWPPCVTGDELDSGFASSTPGRGDAWCYGTLGISRSLSLTGQAIGNPQLTEAANAAITSLADRPTEQWDVEGPTLCHGHAGVLQSASASRTVTAERAATAARSGFDPAHRFAFQHLGDDSANDTPGFLVGAAGVALALADHGGLPAPAVPTRWDALLLLS